VTVPKTPTNPELSLPLWDNKNAVKNRVSLEIGDMIYRSVVEYDYDIPPMRFPRPAAKTKAEMAAEEERWAVEKFRNGETWLLADLVKDRFGDKLEPDTLNLISDVIAKAKVKRSKPKRKRGRPPGRMTGDRRREIYPIHNVAMDAWMIFDCLKKLYPKQSDSSIKDRAAEIASQHEIALNGDLKPKNRIDYHQLRRELRRPPTRHDWHGPWWF
jgi:hypothetical protein